VEWVAISRKKDSKTPLVLADKEDFNHKIRFFKRLMRIFVADMTFSYLKISVKREYYG